MNDYRRDEELRWWQERCLALLPEVEQRIMRILISTPTLTHTTMQLSGLIDVPWNTVSAYLQRMKKKGLITKERQGKQCIWGLPPTRRD